MSIDKDATMDKPVTQNTEQSPPSPLTKSINDLQDDSVEGLEKEDGINYDDGFFGFRKYHPSGQTSRISPRQMTCRRSEHC